MNTQKALKIILIFIGLAIIIFSGIFVIQTLKDLDNLKFSQVKNILHKKEENLGLDIDIDTTNWKTFRNEEFGFEFKYPEEWEKRECQDYEDEDEQKYCKERIKQIIEITNSNLFSQPHMYLTNIGEIDVGISYETNKDNKNLGSILLSFKKDVENKTGKYIDRTYQYSNEDINIEKYNFGNIKSIRESIKITKTTGVSEQQEIYLTFLNKNYIFTIYFGTPLKGSEDSIKIFENILNTFQFS